MKHVSFDKQRNYAAGSMLPRKDFNTTTKMILFERNENETKTLEQAHGILNSNFPVDYI